MTNEGGRVSVLPFFRRLSWRLLNVYAPSVAIGGLTILVVATLLLPPSLDLPLFLFLTLLSTSIRWLGFPIGGVTNSLFGIVDLMTLLLFGPVVAGWQAALAILLHSLLIYIRQGRRTVWATLQLPLFNAGLKAAMALISGAVYLALGGYLRPQGLETNLIVPGLALCGSWFAVDYGAWSLLELFAGGRQRFFQWTHYAVMAALMVELLPLPFAFLGAVISAHLGIRGIVAFAAALLLASLSVNLMARARSRLEARVVELTTLNRVSDEIIRASQDERDICEIVYRYASRVVDTTYFLLGLLNEDGATETLAILIAEGERHEPRTLPVGGVVAWMQEHREPLVVGDLRREQLPFRPRQVGTDAGTVRSAVFVPMLAGQDLIGFMSIQSQLPHSFSADDTRILSAMANQAAMAIANLRLQRQAQMRERLEREVHLASEIQRSLLPSSCPTVPGFELSFDWRSAREVSGDFYDFLALPDGKLGIVIADVSDKGMPAALFMALSRSLVRAALLGASSPAEGLQRANRWIVKDSSSDMFLTLFYAVLDPVNQTLTYVNAGHNPPLLMYHDERTCHYLDKHGIALGILDEVEYQEHTISLCAGDMLLCYTDGVTDAMNGDGDLFGEERLLEIARQYCDHSPQEIIDHINAARESFVDDQPAFDDATLVVVRCANLEGHSS